MGPIILAVESYTPSGKFHLQDGTEPFDPVGYIVQLKSDYARSPPRRKKKGTACVDRGGNDHGGPYRFVRNGKGFLERNHILVFTHKQYGQVELFPSEPPCIEDATLQFILKGKKFSGVHRNGYITTHFHNRVPYMTIEELEALIRLHQDLYYNGEPELTDFDFDRLWDELKERDPTNPLFTEEIGSDEDLSLEKRVHIIPMNSQDKASTPEEFRKWATKVGFGEFLVQYKLDGASLELQYEKGKFTYGVTRGDGSRGDDITRNVRKMKGAIPQLPEPFTGAIRGEVIMLHEIHKSLFSEKANCRNAANGLMKRKDGAGSEHLDIMVYDAGSVDGNDPFSTEIEKVSWLKNLGFSVVKSVVLKGVEAVVNFREEMIEKRETLGFDIDGLVVKGIEIDYEDMKRPRPQKQIAFKFSRQEAVTRLIDVEWSESGHLYTPVAILEPVSIAGTTVRRASLVHPDHIDELHLKIGASVVVSKRGDIIPKVEGVVFSPADARMIEIPSTCSTCGSAVINEGNRLYCGNPQCPRRYFHRLRRWIQVLDIRDFGGVLLRKLFDDGRIKTIPDLYRLELEDLVDYEGMGEKSAKKALDNLYLRKSIPLPTFVAGFDLDGIAELTIEKLVEGGYQTLDSLFGAVPTDLAEVHGIGEVKAEAIVSGIMEVREEMEALLRSGVIEITVTPGASESPLVALSFCFTGALESMSRAEAETEIKRRGGSVRNGVSANLSFLVTNSPGSGSTKNRKARELGVKIISETEFMELLGRRPAQ